MRHRRPSLATSLALVASVCAAVVAWPGAASSGQAGGPGGRGGYVLERDEEVRREEPGPHHGLGRTSGSVFFAGVKGVPFSFRKRVLHPGASIGTHPQTEDEVYYVVSGAGRMTVDGKTFEVKTGDAVLTRPGSSHGLVQAGGDDLVLVIVFPVGGPTPPAAR